MDDQLFQKYLSLPLDHADDTVPELYDELKNVYDIYRQIGGYPKVVETYLNTKDVEAAQKELVRIIRIFLNESMRYFDDITDISVFTNIFLSICRILLREKKGLDEDSISAVSYTHLDVYKRQLPELLSGLSTAGYLPRNSLIPVLPISSSSSYLSLIHI